MVMVNDFILVLLQIESKFRYMSSCVLNALTVQCQLLSRFDLSILSLIQQYSIQMRNCSLEQR